jgi:hypothetical protein
VEEQSHRDKFQGRGKLDASRAFVVWRDYEGQNMNKIYVLQKDELQGELYQRVYLLIRKNLLTRPSIGASFGVGGGLLSIILGALLWAVVALLAPCSFRTLLNTVEIAFFALSLPLLALGAYCLDLLEKRTPFLPLPASSQPMGSGRLHRLRAQIPNKN